MEIKGEAVVGSDGGRESYGGEREWCRGLERGSSPGLIVARVPSSLPMSPRRFPCPRVVACVRASLPVSACCCPCPRIVARVRTCCPWSARRSPRPFTFMGGCFRSWAWVVAFVRGRLSSFWGGCLRSEVVVFVWGCPSSFVGGPSSFVGNSRVWWWGAVGWWW